MQLYSIYLLNIIRCTCGLTTNRPLVAACKSRLGKGSSKSSGTRGVDVVKMVEMEELGE